jgi:hypothetical protein
MNNGCVWTSGWPAVDDVFQRSGSGGIVTLERAKTNLHNLLSDDDDTEGEAEGVAGQDEALCKKYPPSKEPIYRELKLAGRDLSEDELIDLMVKHPDLIQRPIVETGTKAILTRPAEGIREIL